MEHYAGLIELLVTGTICLGFGFQQLWSLKRDKERAAREKAAREAAAPAAGATPEA